MAVTFRWRTCGTGARAERREEETGEAGGAHAPVTGARSPGPGPPGPGSSGPSIFEVLRGAAVLRAFSDLSALFWGQVEVSWKSFQHAGAGGRDWDRSEL